MVLTKWVSEQKKSAHTHSFQRDENCTRCTSTGFCLFFPLLFGRRQLFLKILFHSSVTVAICRSLSSCVHSAFMRFNIYYNCWLVMRMLLLLLLPQCTTIVHTIYQMHMHIVYTKAKVAWSGQALFFHITSLQYVFFLLLLFVLLLSCFTHSFLPIYHPF